MISSCVCVEFEMFLKAAQWLVNLSSKANLSVVGQQQRLGKMDELLPGGPCSLAFFTVRQNEKKRR